MQCPDCPDLLAENMPPGWTPRPRCCRDEHIDRRLLGDFEGWEGIEHARARSDGTPPPSRQVRRAEERARRKAGGRADG